MIFELFQFTEDNDSPVIFRKLFYNISNALAHLSPDKLLINGRRATQGAELDSFLETVIVEA
jgi:hypothetical protein